MRLVLLGLIWAAAAMVVGCDGSRGPKTYKVTGTVKFDGEPIKQGYIIFHPTSPEDRPEAGNITEGRYELRAPAGVKRVEIRGTRVTNKTGAKGEPVQENFVPAAYNTETMLKAEVTDKEPNQIDFDLKAKP